MDAEQGQAIAELGSSQQSVMQSQLVTQETLNTLSEELLPQVQHIDETLTQLQDVVNETGEGVQQINNRIQTMENDMTQMYEVICHDRLTMLDWPELIQVSRIQFQSIRLSGKWDEPFDSTLFIDNPELLHIFEGYIQQRGYARPVFLLLANMGMGKTWNCVNLGQHIRDVNNSALPFFIPIHLGYEELLAEIFGSSELRLIEFIGKKADSIFRKFGKKVLLLFDGLDEFPIPDRQPFLNFLQQLLTQYGKSLWIVISDRITDWWQHPQLQPFHAIITPYISPTPACDPIRARLKIPTALSGYLGEFTDTQLQKAIVKYGFTRNQFPPALYTLAHRPYILRLVLKWKVFPDPADPATFAPYFYNPNDPTLSVLGRMGVIRPVDEYFFRIAECFGTATATKTDRELASLSQMGKDPSWLTLLSCGILQEQQHGFQRIYQFEPEFQPMIADYLQSVNPNPEIVSSITIPDSSLSSNDGSSF